MGKGARIRIQKKQASFDQLTSQRVTGEIRDTILKTMRRDSCIFSTRLYCKIARKAGLDCTPLTVETHVFNPPFANHFIEQGIDNMTWQLEPEVWQRLGDAGGRFVVLGARDDPDSDPKKWAGHLVSVIHCPGRTSMLIDLSIDQAHRPHKDIPLTEPLRFPITLKGFLNGSQSAIGTQIHDGKQLLFIYRSFPDDHSYDIAPDWTREPEVTVSKVRGL